MNFKILSFCVSALYPLALLNLLLHSSRFSFVDFLVFYRCLIYRLTYRLSIIIIYIYFVHVHVQVKMFYDAVGKSGQLVGVDSFSSMWVLGLNSGGLQAW